MSACFRALISVHSCNLRPERSNEIPYDQEFWVLGGCRIRTEQKSRFEHTRTELLAQILRKFEEAGEAMRYLNTKGEVAWKATPRMLSRLADAEQEARDEELAERS